MKDKYAQSGYNETACRKRHRRNDRERAFDVELRQLHYFVNVARKMHLTQAAEEMHVAQSAVSRQIHLLEEELGVLLFTQVGRGLQLTPAGRLFLARVERILNDLDKSVQEVRELIDPEVGEVRIGFPHSLGVNLVPTVVAGFHRNHPNVRFRFRQGKSEKLIQDVLSNETDLAFISPFPVKHAELTGELLITEELYAVLPPGHRLAGEQSIALEQLSSEPFVLFSEGYSLRTIVIEACEKAGFRPIVGFEGEETDTIRGLVAAGMGVSLLPEMALIGPHLLQPARVPLRSPKVTRTIGMIRRAGTKLPLVAEIFRQYILDNVRKPT